MNAWGYDEHAAKRQICQAGTPHSRPGPAHPPLQREAGPVMAPGPEGHRDGGPSRQKYGRQLD